MRDPAVVVSFPLVEDPTVSFVAWTTTPWTLPSNLALCVNPEMIYIQFIDIKTNQIYIMAKSRLAQLYPIMNNKKKWKPEMANELYNNMNPNNHNNNNFIIPTSVLIWKYYSFRI